MCSVGIRHYYNSLPIKCGGVITLMVLPKSNRLSPWPVSNYSFSQSKSCTESNEPGPVKYTILLECGDLAKNLPHSLAGMLSRTHRIVDTGVRDHSDLPAQAVTSILISTSRYVHVRYVMVLQRSLFSAEPHHTLMMSIY